MSLLGECPKIFINNIEASFEQKKFISKTLEETNLSVRATNCLRNINCKHIGDIIHLNEEDIKRSPNMGKKSFNEIVSLIETANMKIGDNIEPWSYEIAESIRAYIEKNDKESLSKINSRIKNKLIENFGEELITHILLEKRFEAEEELYIGISYDLRQQCPVMMICRQGGVDIEEMVQKNPEMIDRLVLPSERMFRPYHVVEWFSKVGFEGEILKSLADVATKLVDVFFEYDLLLLEINPLAISVSGDFSALDCHIEIDDDALIRSPLAGSKYGKEGRQGNRKLTVLEKKALEIDQMDHRGVAGRLVEFSGDLGLLIGGGGASLTIFDAVQRQGGSPANYCEIGGNPSVRKVVALTRLLLEQPQVKKLAVIMNVVSNTRSDLVARGVIKGIQEAGKDARDVLTVFRLPGAGEEECRKLLKHYGVSFSGRDISLDQAVSQAVNCT